MTGLAWTVLAVAAAITTAVAGRTLRPRIAARRARREQAARARLQQLAAEVARARPEAEFWQLLAEHPELTKDDG